MVNNERVVGESLTRTIHYKHLLIFGLFFSIILCSNCGNNDDPVADTLTNNDGLDDDSNVLIDAAWDGVTYADDTCADTPDGSIVDSYGCSDSQKDTDGDGVTDDLDGCADTPEVAMVDENGCELIFIYFEIVLSIYYLWWLYI